MFNAAQFNGVQFNSLGMFIKAALQYVPPSLALQMIVSDISSVTMQTADTTAIPRNPETVTPMQIASESTRLANQDNTVIMR